MRFRKALVAQGLNKVLFDRITAQLKAKAIKVKTGTLVDATIIGSASEDDTESNRKLNSAASNRDCSGRAGRLLFEGMPSHPVPATSVLRGEDADLMKPIAFPEAETLNLAFSRIADPRVRKRFVSLVRAIAQMDE